MITLCKTCGTSYEVTGAHPEHCDICLDERQYVPTSGQKWIDFDTLCASHTNKWKQHDSTLLSIRTVPDFAIDQRAFLVRTPEGNILWDCIATLDDATKTLITSLGGLKAIAISHPHYYTTMQDWAAEFNAPIYLHASDRRWVMRDSPWIRFWDGDTIELTRDVTMIRLGGHFAGGCVRTGHVTKAWCFLATSFKLHQVPMQSLLCGATPICYRCQPPPSATSSNA